MLYQSGYLTIKDWDYEDNTYAIDFPNSEVRKGLMSLLAQDEDKGYTTPYLSDPRQLYRIGVNISSDTRTVSEWKVK